LCDDDAIEGGGVSAVREECGGFGEVGDTGDAGVFFVEFGGDYFFFGGADGGEDVGFALIIAVCADAWGGS
jgi:hypothetical protein